MIEFIQDDDRLRDERKKAKKNKDKYVGLSNDSMGFRSSRGFDSWQDRWPGGGSSSGGGRHDGDSGGFRDNSPDFDERRGSPGVDDFKDENQDDDDGFGDFGRQRAAATTSTSTVRQQPSPVAASSNNNLGNGNAKPKPKQQRARKPIDLGAAAAFAQTTQAQPPPQQQQPTALVEETPAPVAAPAPTATNNQLLDDLFASSDNQGYQAIRSDDGNPVPVSANRADGDFGDFSAAFPSNSGQGNINNNDNCDWKYNSDVLQFFNLGDELNKDDERLRGARKKTKKNKDKYVGLCNDSIGFRSSRVFDSWQDHWPGGGRHDRDSGGFRNNSPDKQQQHGFSYHAATTNAPLVGGGGAPSSGPSGRPPLQGSMSPTSLPSMDFASALSNRAATTTPSVNSNAQQDLLTARAPPPTPDSLMGCGGSAPIQSANSDLLGGLSLASALPSGLMRPLNPSTQVHGGYAECNKANGDFGDFSAAFPSNSGQGNNNNNQPDKFEDFSSAFSNPAATTNAPSGWPRGRPPLQGNLMSPLRLLNPSGTAESAPGGDAESKKTADVVPKSWGNVGDLDIDLDNLSLSNRTQKKAAVPMNAMKTAGVSPASSSDSPMSPSRGPFPGPAMSGGAGVPAQQQQKVVNNNNLFGDLL